MSEAAISDLWVSSGHHLLDRDSHGRLVITDAFLKAYLARPEIMPPEGACDIERRLHARLLQEHPSFAMRFDVDADISQAEVALLLAMSEAKIRGQGKTFAVDPGYARAMTALSRRCGFLAVATIDGKVCAGLICYRIGHGFAAKVVAHDAKYDAYWLGTLCYYFTICEAIRRGGRVFNMGSQRYEYKERLLGVRRDLDHLTIYRSRWKQLRHADVMLQMALGRIIRQAKLWIRERERCKAAGIGGGSGRVVARIAQRLVTGYRGVLSLLNGRH